MKNKEPLGKFDDVFVIEGKLKVGMADKKGNNLGTTEVLLKDVWIKLPAKRKK